MTVLDLLLKNQYRLMSQGMEFDKAAWKDKLSILKSKVEQEDWKTNPGDILATIYELHPKSFKDDKLGMNNFIQTLVNLDRVYTNVTGLMVLRELFKTCVNIPLFVKLDKDYRADFSKYAYILETCDSGLIKQDELNRKIENSILTKHDYYVNITLEVSLLLGRLGVKGYIQLLEIFYNLPVRLG